jgi:GH24 family phage-related lysozyme (muramidase)
MTFIKRYSRTLLSQNQFDALVSVGLNSPRALNEILHKYNNSGFVSQADFINSLVPATRSNQGLVNRRIGEATLFNTGNYGARR